MEKSDTNQKRTYQRTNTKPLLDSDSIEELRKRLYARDSVHTSRVVRHDIPERTTLVSTSHIDTPISTPTPQTTIPPPTHVDTPHATQEEMMSSHEITKHTMSKKNTRNTLRKNSIIGGIIFFMVAVGIASFYIFWGGNVISGENISITASGAITIGGGEEYGFQVAVANQNTVPIHSAILVVEYPKGTREAGDSEKEVNTIRQSLNTIDTGEVVNIPLKARIFGEENESKEIKVWIEYGIVGSNSTFRKEAKPVAFTVATSPIVVTFDTVKTISSGQEIEMNIIIQSNAPTTVTNLLVKMQYPEGFDFTTSKPDTTSGEDTWNIATIEPNEKKTILIKGLLTGYENDTRHFSVQAGISKENEPNTIGFQLSNTETDIVIEKPFLQAHVVINGSSNETIVMRSDADADVYIEYHNTLDTTIYDGVVSVHLEGNALDDYSVRTDGHYNSTQNMITWDGSNHSDLTEIVPGASTRLGFSLKPLHTVESTPEITIKADVMGSRLYENRSSQDIKGSVFRTIKIEGVPEIVARTIFSEGPFVNTGHVPPVVGEATQYTYIFSAKAGVNDLTDTEVTAIIPQGVTWLDVVKGDGEVTYNTVTRTMRWNIGNISANKEVTTGIQVSFTPSASDEGRIPTILETQRFKATDRFTGTIVRTTAPALSTDFSENGIDKDSVGRVVSP
jgi:hypothetical protein